MGAKKFENCFKVNIVNHLHENVFYYKKINHMQGNVLETMVQYEVYLLQEQQWVTS